MVFKDAHQYAKECLPYNRDARLTDAIRMPHQPILPLGPFQIDLVGPIKPLAKYIRTQYILGETNYCIKWVDVVALKGNNAKSVAKTFYHNIMTRFGVLIEIVLDRGTHILNKVIKRMTKLHMMLYKKSTAYYPQGNGQIETSNKIMKKIFRRTILLTFLRIGIKI